MKHVGRLLLLAVISAALSCGTQDDRPLNVMIIGVDTLRPDHLGCYGYHRDTSPNTDRLAREGVLFEDAVSQSPWTLPSFATLFTSLYPSQHGAGFLEQGAGTYGRRMQTAFPSLAMMLLKRGYTTGAIVNAPALAPEFGVDKGFEVYDTTPRWDRRIADGTTIDALAWLDLNKDGPFLVFVHYFDPHLTYEPPAPYDTLFDPGYGGRIGPSFDRETYMEMKDVLSRENDPEARADWDHIRALYDGEIAFTDKAIGDLMAGLEDLGLKDNTLIIYLSDHGEEFFEHQGFEHGHTLFDELIKVPLIFSLPGVIRENVRVSQQVRLIDVMPTILDIVGITPRTHLEGASLKPLIKGEGSIAESKTSLLPARFAYSESMLYGTEKKSITAYPWKLIYDTVTEEEMLFNLAHDPSEHNDLIATESEAGSLLEDMIFATMFSLSETWFVELSGGTQGHTFDLLLNVQRRPTAGSIKTCKVLDAEGHVTANDRLAFKELSSKTVELEGQELAGTVRLALQIDPTRIPVEFHLKIDGEPATERTFLGEHLSAPGGMPFVEKATRRAPSKGRPGSRPEPPYVLIWHAGGELEAETPVRLSEETKDKLRALGYIQ